MGRGKFGIFITYITVLVIVILSLCFNTKHVSAEDTSVNVKYKTHVQNIGWQSYVSNGNISGTVGKSLRLEGINIQVEGSSNLGVKYRTHVQNIGWQDYVSNGTLSGTTGKSLRLEAIKVELTGADSDKYDIYYSVHAQDYGWLDWAKNGAAAGTEGLSKRLEAIKIMIVPKGSNTGLTVSRPFVSKYGIGRISYRTHVQNYGWQNYVTDGKLSGTVGKSLRLEAINIRLGTDMPGGSVVYSSHIQNYGWVSSVSDGKLSGTVGESKRLEAIKISLTGDVSNQYDIYYHVYVQNIGWLDWAKNGQSAGTTGLSYRIEGIEIQMVIKGGAAPGNTVKPFIKSGFIVENLISTGSSQQVIIVTSNYWNSKQATFQAFEKINGVWKQSFSPRICNVGYNGISVNKHEGDGTTPAGRFDMGYAFGWGGNPGTSLEYKLAGSDDYWVSGKTLDLYNVWVHKTGGPDPVWGGEDSYEKLNHPLYKYASVINYNMGLSKVIGKGSGIFFHIASYNMGPTAGCVSLPQNDVISVLRWMDPGKNPIIIIGQKDWVLKNM